MVDRLRLQAPGRSLRICSRSAPPARKVVGNVGWNGSEIVAFRLHLPSKIAYHNAHVENFRRGNILVWEQALTDRLSGQPLVLDARMQTESILYRTLTLFGLTFLGVAACVRGDHLVGRRREDRGKGGRVPENDTRPLTHLPESRP